MISLMKNPEVNWFIYRSEDIFTDKDDYSDAGDYVYAVVHEWARRLSPVMLHPTLLNIQVWLYILGVGLPRLGSFAPS
jgi:hypothetical protein